MKSLGGMGELAFDIWQALSMEEKRSLLELRDQSSVYCTPRLERLQLVFKGFSCYILSPLGSELLELISEQASQRSERIMFVLVWVPGVTSWVEMPRSYLPQIHLMDARMIDKDPFLELKDEDFPAMDVSAIIVREFNVKSALLLTEIFDQSTTAEEQAIQIIDERWINRVSAAQQLRRLFRFGYIQKACDQYASEDAPPTKSETKSIAPVNKGANGAG